MHTSLKIRSATVEDVALVLTFIKKLAEEENLSHECVATEKMLRDTLFIEKPYAEVILGFFDERPVSFAVFFHNYSTLLGQPGIYIADIFVDSQMRHQGVGKTMGAYLAKLAQQRNCGFLEWCGLDKDQRAIDFYHKIGAKPLEQWTAYRLTGKAFLAASSPS